MPPELDRQKKPSLQPKLWLLATSVGLGIGVGLLVGPQRDIRHPMGRPGWEFFLFAAIVQLALGWLAMRGGEDPDSFLSNFVRANPPYGAQLDLEPKPILWFFAYILFLMGSVLGTISLTSLLAAR